MFTGSNYGVSKVFCYRRIAVWNLDVMTLLLLFIPAIPNLWGIWHAYHRFFPTQQERLIWLGVCIFVPVLGGLAYLIFGMRRAKKTPQDG